MGCDTPHFSKNWSVKRRFCLERPDLSVNWWQVDQLIDGKLISKLMAKLSCSVKQENHRGTPPPRHTPATPHHMVRHCESFKCKDCHSVKQQPFNVYTILMLQNARSKNVCWLNNWLHTYLFTDSQITKFVHYARRGLYIIYTNTLLNITKNASIITILERVCYTSSHVWLQWPCIHFRDTYLSIEK